MSIPARWRATAAFDHGSTEIAIDYLQRAISCARGIRRAGLQCQLQGYRIATHRFDEAAREEAPARNLPAKVAAFLSMARGWGAVMSGSPEPGIADLRQAAAGLGDDPDEKFKSYLRNITALGLAQLGALDEAMAQEEIVARQNSGQDRSWPLHYVNHVNMARLYRRQGNYPEARRHYDEAFASHWGGRSASDRWCCVRETFSSSKRSSGPAPARPTTRTRCIARRCASHASSLRSTRSRSSPSSRLSGRRRMRCGSRSASRPSESTVSCDTG